KPGKAWPLASGQYFGPITGPADSHGGWASWEKPYVKWIQKRLTAHGYPVKATGTFDDATKHAVSKWQRDNYAATTSIYGSVWADDYKHLQQEADDLPYSKKELETLMRKAVKAERRR